MDVTLNHLGEQQILAVLNKAQPFIENGRLNLILLQSGTKFFQHGMDRVNIDTAQVFNDGDEWLDVSEARDAYDQQVPREDELYIAKMLATNKQTLGAYLQKIRDNTLFLRPRPAQDLEKDGNGLTLTRNEDPQTVYLSLKPKRALVEKRFGAWSEDHQQTVNQEIYKDHLLPALLDLPIVDRPSFGFNITNLGECLTMVRITLGIDQPGLLERFVVTVYVAGLGRDRSPLPMPGRHVCCGAPNGAPCLSASQGFALGRALC